MKRPYLAVHDYGTGGVWAYVWAESAEDIEARFDVAVVEELPTWLVGEERGLVSLDIDSPPPKWLPLR
jgi:hypothetical protein